VSQNAEIESRPRVLFIGLDAADRELIDRWCAEGYLKNISSMRESGIWADMQTTADVMHVSAWPSIFTGTDTDQHGLYHAYVMREGQQTPARPQPDRCPVPFVWDVLDKRGKRCIVMDAFLTCPLRDFGGVQIVDWGTWTHFTEPTITPADLKQKLQSRFGPYPAEDHSQVGMTPPPDPSGFRKRLLEAVEKKTEIIKWLMDTEDWDFFLAVFGECHPAGHYFWHYQDSDYDAYPDECDAELRTALRDVYVALDEAIGKLLEQVDSETTVFVVSGDGMGPNYSGSHILNEMLTKMRLMNDQGSDEEADSQPDSEKSDGAARSQGLLSRLRGMVPREFRALVSKHLLPQWVNERLSLHWKTADIDWKKTRAFLIDNANEGYIRVNKAGREPEGIVESQSEFDSICDELVDVARKMTNPATGKRAACEVRRTDELYSGPCRHQMPDVIINWDPEARVTTALATETFGTVDVDKPGYGVSPFYTGNHLPNAFMAAVGPRIPKGRELKNASILDFAPTIFQHFDVELPSHVSGNTLEINEPGD